MISLNLSKQCLSAANSRMKGLYFSSVGDICLDEKPMGGTVVLVVPLGRSEVKVWERIPAKQYLHPSVLMMNGVSSFFGPFSTGSLVSATFSRRNAWSCSLFPSPLREYPFMALVYAAFPFSLGKSSFRARSVSGWTIDVYPLMRERK